MKKVIKKAVVKKAVVKKAKEELMGVVEEKAILNNGMIKESAEKADVYCDACGAALKQVGNNLFNMNDDCNEFNKL